MIVDTDLPQYISEGPNLERLHKWRKRARIVAYLDLSLIIVNLFMCMVITAGATALMSSPQHNNMRNRTEVIKSKGPERKYGQEINSERRAAARLWVIWTTAAIIAITSAFQIWAVSKLFNATLIETDALSSLVQCEFWRTITVIILIAQCISNVIQGNYIGSLFDILVRVVFLLVVDKFMIELRNVYLNPVTSPAVVLGPASRYVHPMNDHGPV